jgi:diadenosine tetraphosphate (Ap4A) HIT family hydrolase
MKDLLDRESLEIMQTLQRCQEVLEYVVQPHDYDIGITAGKVRNSFPAQHMVYQVVPRKKYDKNLMQIVRTRAELHALLKGTYKDLKNAFADINLPV